MKRMAFLSLPLAFSAAAAFAETVLPLVKDDDNSGNYSATELRTVWPDLTPEGFAAIDTDADGAVTSAELQVAIDNGVLKAPTPVPM